jgi:CRISPR-associated protein Csy3
MAKVEKLDKVEFPSVLAYEKKLVPSDGRLFGLNFTERGTDAGRPLKLHEKAVRGTISNRLSAKQEKDPAKLDAEVEKANLQTVDHCSLPADCDCLKLHFTLKVLPGVQQPSACNSSAFQESCGQAIERYIQETGFEELGKRYATNLANGRFLWRNRLGAEDLEIVVQQLDGNEKKHWKFDGWQIGLNNFDNPSITDLGAIIASTLSGRRSYLLLDVVAYAKIGPGQEVYPSEELVTKKEEKSKVLYSVDGIAALHSQKIGNAIRTIDTWYSAETRNPIAVEAYGAVTNLGVAFRKPTQRTDFYTLFDDFGMGNAIDSEQRHYVMAMLVRGGVFGKSSK